MALRKLQNFIGGEYRDAVDGRTSTLVNPSTGEGFAEAPVSGQADVDAAMQAAERGFEQWRDATPSERSRALLKIADAMEERAEELVRLESENTGKPVQLTLDEEVPPAIDQIRFFAGAARMLNGLSAGEYMAGHTSMIRREPVGICAQVTPWNYPFMMAVWKFAPAIAAGNAVVLKPSDTTPVTTIWMAELMSEFLPDGVMNVIVGDRATGAALVSHKAPAMVSITGSIRAGKRGRQGGRRRPQAGPPGARRQGPGDRVRRRRRGRRGRDDRRHRLLQRRPGLHRRHPGAGRRPGSTTTSCPPWSSRPRAPPPAPPRTPRPPTAPSTTPTSWPGSRASWTAPPATPRSPPAATSWTAAATSTSPPSSTASSRTTR